MFVFDRGKVCVSYLYDTVANPDFLKEPNQIIHLIGLKMPAVQSLMPHIKCIFSKLKSSIASTFWMKAKNKNGAGSECILYSQDCVWTFEV